MNLYEMTTTTNELMRLYENHEIDEQTMNDTLDSIGVEGKLEDYCKVIATINAEVDAFKKEIERLTDAKKRAEKNVENMKSRIALYMEAKSSKSEKAGLFTITRRESDSCVIDNIDDVPEEFKTVVTTVNPDKVAIKKAIALNENFTGAHIETKSSITIK